MRALFFGMMVGIAACNIGSDSNSSPDIATPMDLGIPTASIYKPVGMLPPKPQGVPASTPTYLIDAKASVSLTSKGYGITADGKGSYTLSWRSDSILHSFSGDIYCPPTCTLSATFVSIVPGTSISFSGNYVQFSADTTAPGSNGLIITPTCQPLSLNLLIDSQPALSPFSLFQSNGRLSATSVMPFSLVDSSAGL